jgi:hypothetical protein
MKCDCGRDMVPLGPRYSVCPVPLSEHRSIATGGRRDG